MHKMFVVGVRGERAGVVVHVVKWVSDHISVGTFSWCNDNMYNIMYRLVLLCGPPPRRTRNNIWMKTKTATCVGKVRAYLQCARGVVINAHVNVVRINRNII